MNRKALAVVGLFQLVAGFYLLAAYGSAIAGLMPRQSLVSDVEGATVVFGESASFTVYSESPDYNYFTWYLDGEPVWQDSGGSSTYVTDSGLAVGEHYLVCSDYIGQSIEFSVTVLPLNSQPTPSPVLSPSPSSSPSASSGPFDLFGSPLAPPLPFVPSTKMYSLLFAVLSLPLLASGTVCLVLVARNRRK